MQNTYKLYSHRSITMATFFGGPVAAGYLARQNYLNLNQPQKAYNAMLLGFFYTVLIIMVAILLPDEFSDRNLNMAVYFFNVLIIYFIVEATQGKALKKHKKKNGKFYSAWNAVGAGLIVMFIMLVFFVLLFFVSEELVSDANHFEKDIYQKEMQVFENNEKQALAILNENIELQDTIYLIRKINKGISLWEENQEIINNLEESEDIIPELSSLNKKLLEYCELRLEQYRLIKQSLSSKNSTAFRKAQRIGNKINRLVKEIETQLSP